MRKKSTGKAQNARQDRAIGPLVVSKANPRYFTVLSENGSEQSAIYLTGSHIWNNFHDGMGLGPDCSGTPEQLDFDEYLKFLKDHGHNFIATFSQDHNILTGHWETSTDGTNWEHDFNIKYTNRNLSQKVR